jgi:rhodanese-related sulfurtransferase
MGTIGGVSSLSAGELAGRIARNVPVALLDVREPDERSFCAIAAPAPSVDLHVPMGSVADRLAAIRDATAGLPLVVYCHHGVRSRMAAEWLSRQGLKDVHNLEGGIDDWSRSVDPAVPRY